MVAWEGRTEKGEGGKEGAFYIVCKSHKGPPPPRLRPSPFPPGVPYQLCRPYQWITRRTYQAKEYAARGKSLFVGNG